MQVMIQSFRDQNTLKVFSRDRVRQLSTNVQRAAYKKLAMLDAAENLQDLRIPPGNRLEKLSANREGQHSIRINEQWRICFVWKNQGAFDVEITDYHP
jgi:proteic killer suppression protein